MSYAVRLELFDDRILEADAESEADALERVAQVVVLVPRFRRLVIEEVV